MKLLQNTAFKFLQAVFNKQSAAQLCVHLWEVHFCFVVSTTVLSYSVLQIIHESIHEKWEMYRKEVNIHIDKHRYIIRLSLNAIVMSLIFVETCGKTGPWRVSLFDEYLLVLLGPKLIPIWASHTCHMVFTALSHLSRKHFIIMAWRTWAWRPTEIGFYKLKETLHPGAPFYYNYCLPLTIHPKYFIIKFGQIICLGLKVVCHWNVILSLILLLPRQTRRNQFQGERKEEEEEGEREEKRREKLDHKR